MRHDTFHPSKATVPEKHPLLHCILTQQRGLSVEELNLRPIRFNGYGQACRVALEMRRAQVELPSHAISLGRIQFVHVPVVLPVRADQCLYHRRLERAPGTIEIGVVHQADHGVALCNDDG